MTTTLGGLVRVHDFEQIRVKTDALMRLTTSGHERVARPVRLSPLVAAPLIAGALLLVFALDRTTGSTPVQHLYYLPIILAGYVFGVRGGLITGVSAIALYHAANPSLMSFRYGESDLVQIVLFLAVGLITARLMSDGERLRRLAMTDDLTGLHNLRSFEERLAAIVRASRETGAPMALLVLDVDRLKALNDEHGHLTGAEAVRTVGHIIGHRLPADAAACRYGGDEFAIAVPRCSPFRMCEIADELCLAVYACEPLLAGRRFPAGTLSISVGAAARSFDRAPLHVVSGREADAGEVLFRSADAALYQAKTRGRNQVCVA